HGPDRLGERLVEQPSAQHPVRGPVVLPRPERGVALGVLAQQRDGGTALVRRAARGGEDRPRARLVGEHGPRAAHVGGVDPASVRARRPALGELAAEQADVLQLHAVGGADVVVPPPAPLPRQDRDRVHRYATPPSMSMVAPLMNEPASEQSQTTAPATSATVPPRPTPMPAIMAFCASGGVNVSWKAVPPMKPGASALTVIPSGPSSLARPLVSPTTPAFAAA